MGAPYLMRHLPAGRIVVSFQTREWHHTRSRSDKSSGTFHWALVDNRVGQVKAVIISSCIAIAALGIAVFGIGSLLANWLIGAIATTYGLGQGFSLITVFLFAVLFCILVLFESIMVRSQGRNRYDR